MNRPLGQGYFLIGGAERFLALTAGEAITAADPVRRRALPGRPGGLYLEQGLDLLPRCPTRRVGGAFAVTNQDLVVVTAGGSIASRRATPIPVGSLWVGRRASADEDRGARRDRPAAREDRQGAPGEAARGPPAPRAPRLRRRSMRRSAPACAPRRHARRRGATSSRRRGCSNARAIQRRPGSSSGRRWGLGVGLSRGQFARRRARTDHGRQLACAPRFVAVPNSEHLTSFAPSIRRAKS